MKKFKFELAALLKMRKLKEDQCKTEVGRIQVNIQQAHKAIAQHRSDIEEAFESQRVSLSSQISAQEVKFYPYFVEGKDQTIKNLESEIKRLEELKQEKLLELAKFRADVKVLENMEDKKRKNYKKEIAKKEQTQLEEQVLIWDMAKRLR